ncbi:hypothetical protein A3841_08935 [Pontibacter flavimaris]|uniref:Uncharacterized protein n=1 Tax=Pontibacter flavimaris TaxID=1797110 RepID=A0A1Q5PIS8_9BACT|nr:hypothetical protein A3841_08935 [Pontibacter flavimaris]
MYRFVYDSDDGLGLSIILVSIFALLAVVLYLIKFTLIKTGLKTHEEMRNFISDGIDELGAGLTFFIGYFLASVFVMMVATILLKFIGIPSKIKGLYTHVWILITLCLGYWSYFVIKQVFSFCRFVINRNNK